MSQWGEERRFIGTNAEIRVIPDVDPGSPFDPLHLEDKIRTVFILHAEGDSKEIDELVGQVRRQFVGKPYSEWQRPFPNPPVNLVMARTAPPTRKNPPPPPNEARTAGIYDQRRIFLASQRLPPDCDADQFSDSVVCPCGIKFDVNDPDPPRCPRDAARTLGIAVEGRKGLQGYPTLPQGPSPPPRASRWLLWASLVILAAAIGWSLLT